MPSARAVCSGTTANASLISHRSMSLTVMPAFLSALAEAGAGAVSMISGSAPAGRLPRGRGPGGRQRADPGARLERGGLAPLGRADQDDGGTVDDSRRVTGGVDVLDLLGVRVALERELIDGLAAAAHRRGAELLERRLELG